MMTFPIYGKINNVPNHQPVIINHYEPLLTTINFHGSSHHQSQHQLTDSARDAHSSVGSNSFPPSAPLSAQRLRSTHGASEHSDGTECNGHAVGVGCHDEKLGTNQDPHVSSLSVTEYRMRGVNDVMP
jgi:hypothetical protein